MAAPFGDGNTSFWVAVNGPPGAVARRTLRSAFAAPESIAALTSAGGGAPALAYVTSASRGVVVHAGIDGATRPPDGPLPRVRIEAPKPPVIVNGTVRLSVSCDGPCEVAADVLGHRVYANSVRLPSEGTGLIEFFSSSWAVRERGSVRVRLTYGAPGALNPRTKIVTVRLLRADTLPSVRVTGVSAERRAGKVVVRWRTNRKLAESAGAYVSGAGTRTWSGEPVQVLDARMAKGRRSFATTLTRQAARIRWVTLRFYNEQEPIVVKVK